MANEILSVTQFTKALREVAEPLFGDVQLKGEISNYKLHSSGHRYFSLKDAGAQVSCAIWKGTRLPVALGDGMEVVIRGYLSFYAPRGNYQIVCRSVVPAGVGGLQQSFEELKSRLRDEGLFDADRKNELPLLPSRIGVATSETGAALRDIITTLARRFPIAKVLLAPCAVQGDIAPSSIVDALRRLDGQCEVIIVGRGGGSIEDLWAFNTEEVVRAVAALATPVVSAVGHETDVVLTDFAADRRAPTPTAAAELVTPDINRLKANLNASAQFIGDLTKDTLAHHKRHLLMLSQHYALRSTRDLPRRYREELFEARESMQKYVKKAIQELHNTIRTKEQTLHSLHPLAPLNKGYALLREATSNAHIQTETMLEPNSTIIIERKYDKATALVTESRKV